MLIEPTKEKLGSLKLPAMLRAWEAQEQDAKIHELGFDERLGMLVDAEWIERQNKRLARALREAKLRIPNACMEDTEPRKALTRKQLRELATCTWIDAHHNIAITGPTGVGKTYVACALA
ncbi:MAG: ATP-binding protein, partial [bacterium]|nr:ATP-binding protein [bacterium]